MPTGISSTSAGIPSVSRRSVPLVVYGEDRGRRATPPGGAPGLGWKPAAADSSGAARSPGR